MSGKQSRTPGAVLIEGADCAGKSTLAKELKNHLSYDLIALSHRPGDQHERYRHFYELEGVVFERGHVSEMVYSRLFGRPAPFSELERRDLDTIVAGRMLVIHAHPELALARSRYRARDGVLQPTALSELGQTIDLFAAELTSSHFPLRIAYGSSDLDELAAVVQIAERICAGVGACR
jgi:thymidylate kinase